MTWFAFAKQAVRNGKSLEFTSDVPGSRALAGSRQPLDEDQSGCEHACLARSLSHPTIPALVAASTPSARTQIYHSWSVARSWCGFRVPLGEHRLGGQPIQWPVGASPLLVVSDIGGGITRIMLEPHPGERLIDIVGGPLRHLAEMHACRVSGMDLTDEFVAAAIDFTRRARLSDRVDFRLNWPTASAASRTPRQAART